jgi:succinate-acetate transporter protein
MEITEKDKKELGNATKFGLAGIATALFMLGFAWCEVITLNAVVLATVLTMGFIAPVLAASMEFLKGNSYRTTILMLFGLFFLTFFIFSTRVYGAAPTTTAVGLFYIVWALATCKFFAGIISKRMGIKNIMLAAILGLFLATLVFLAIASFTGTRGLIITAGVFALLTTLTIYIDFMLHIYMRIKKDMGAMN